MTFCTWAAMTLRFVNSGFWKRLRMRRSVRQMLYEHLVDPLLGEAGTQRRAAEGNKCAKRLVEFPVLRVRFRDVLPQRLSKIGNAALELVHGALKFALIRFVVREESIEKRRNLQRLAEGEFVRLAPVLV